MPRGELKDRAAKNETEQKKALAPVFMESRPIFLGAAVLNEGGVLKRYYGNQITDA